MAGGDHGKSIILFDVDGTLTVPRQVIHPKIKSFLLDKLHKDIDIGLVGGSDIKKISEQLGGSDTLKYFDFVFAENGLYAMKNGEVFSKENIAQHLGEKVLQKFLNGCLKYLSEVELPVKRGTFIEFRNGMLNVSPIGRNCSQEERNAFEEYDREYQVRAKFISYLEDKFPDLPLVYVIGGQISFDVFPKGWDKSYCLQFLDSYSKVFFFGDKCEPGGNDYEIFSNPRVIGFKVQNPEDTVRKIDQNYKELIF